MPADVKDKLRNENIRLQKQIEVLTKIVELSQDLNKTLEKRVHELTAIVESTYGNTETVLRILKGNIK